MDYYLGEVRVFAGMVVPDGWHLCDGSVLNISAYSPLYSLIGTIYGGDGVNTFGLPNLVGNTANQVGNIAIGQGQGPGLSARPLGQAGGIPAVTLTQQEMPAHNHGLNVTTAPATTAVPSATVALAAPNTANDIFYVNPNLPNTKFFDPMNTQSISISGTNVAHDNVMPCMAVRYIIATSGGIYPSFQS